MKLSGPVQLMVLEVCTKFERNQPQGGTNWVLHLCNHVVFMLKSEVEFFLEVFESVKRTVYGTVKEMELLREIM